MEEKKVILEIKDLHIEFHDHLKPETVVQNLNLTVEEGEIIGIVGESGSGKSMTALAVAGLLNRHDMKKQGQILFDGVDLLHCSRAELRKYQGKDIGIVFQEPMTSLNPVKRIGWQVEESLKLHTNMDAKQRYDRTIEMLQKAELRDAKQLYDKYPHQLSGGMRQRVMIAAAMVCGPKLLLADEPTTALDVTIQAQIVKLLLKMNQEEKTSILFISHDLSLVRKLCSRILVMQDGYVVEEGQTQTLFAHPKHAYTKTLLDAIPTVKKEQVNHE